MRITYTQRPSPETLRFADMTEVPIPLAASSRFLAIVNSETHVKSVSLVDFSPPPGMAAAETIAARQAGHAALNTILQNHVNNPDAPLVELLPATKDRHLHIGEVLFKPHAAPRITTIGSIASGVFFDSEVRKTLPHVKSWQHASYRDITLSTLPSTPYDMLTLRIDVP